jgi:hypothetical protein
VHLAIKPVVKTLEWWVFPTLWAAGLISNTTLAIALVAGGAIGRSAYTLGRIGQATLRGQQRPWIALGVGVLPVVGNVACPAQLLCCSVHDRDELARFILSDTIARVGRAVPIWGGADTLTEHRFHRWGGLVRIDFSDHAYGMFGMGDSSVESAVAPWNAVDDSSWYQLFEIGWTLANPGLGTGTYRSIPWHNELPDEDGWGLGLSFDQALGPDGLQAFFRFRMAEEGVAPVQTFVSGGPAVHGPFGRAADTAAIGVSWSDPGDGGGRSETIIESYHQLGLSPSVFLAIFRCPGREAEAVIARLSTALRS